MKHPHMMKKPRNHAGLAWEGATLSNDFVDVNRMALDDRYGKVGAPLSKRRNGVGFTDGNTIGLFGIGHRVPMRESGVNYSEDEIATWVDNQRILTRQPLQTTIRENTDKYASMDEYLRGRIDNTNERITRNQQTHSQFHVDDLKDQSVEINWAENMPISHSTQLKYGLGIGLALVVSMFAYDRMHSRIRHPEY